MNNYSNTEQTQMETNKNIVRIISGDWFKEQFTLWTLNKLCVLSKEFSRAFDEEKHEVETENDVHMYTWERRHNLYVIIWGRAWCHNLLKNDDTLFYKSHAILDDGSSYLHICETLCEDEDLYDIMDHAYPNGYNHIVGRENKDVGELCECPLIINDTWV